MTPEYGATAGMFYIDEQTIEYLKLTGREDEQVTLVEHYAKHAGYWADSLKEVEYERGRCCDSFSCLASRSLGSISQLY